MADPVNPNTKNVFSELFGEDAGIAPHVSQNVVDAVAQKAEAVPTFAPIEPLPTVKTTAPGKMGKYLIQLSLLVWLGLGIFFYTQNVASFDWFGVNPARSAQLAEEQVERLNAEIQVQKALASVLMMDSLVQTADEYFYNQSQAQSPFYSESKQAEFEAKAKTRREKITTLLQSLQENLGEPLSADEKAAASVVIDEFLVELSGQEQDGIAQDIADLNTTKLLLNEDPFLSMLSTIEPEKASDEEIQALMAAYSTMSQNVSTTINAIREDRIEWITYINGIERLTKSVDPLFNTEFPGNLSLNEVNFGMDGTVQLSGDSSTDDSKNFTLISNLIDIFEKSELFKDVEERNYSKSSGRDSAYTGGFDLKFILEPLKD
jgi:hypothetical protein